MILNILKKFWKTTIGIYEDIKEGKRLMMLAIFMGFLLGLASLLF